MKISRDHYLVKKKVWLESQTFPLRGPHMNSLALSFSIGTENGKVSEHTRRN